MMTNKHSNSNDSESTVLGWKFVAIVAVITTIFFTCLYLAMSDEPDYMQHKKRSHATFSKDAAQDTTAALSGSKQTQ